MAYKLVGYFENWAQYRPDGQGKFLPEQIDPTLFTHINYAFGLFGFITWSVNPSETLTGPQRYTGDYTIQPVEWNDNIATWGTPPRPGLYQSLQLLKEKNPNLKTLLSIGGWSINSADDMPNPGNPHPYGPYTYQLFSKMAADPQGRTQFITSAIAYTQKYGFDGVDIDWEYPSYIGRGGTLDDLANFLALVQEFRATAGPGFLLTMAAPAIVPTGLPQTYHDNPSTYFQWLQQCSQSFDWLNVMSYDYHGAFDDPVKIGTGVNSPLAQDSTPNGAFSVKQTVETYLAAGIPSDKIVLGMPTYGRSFTVVDPGRLASDNGYGKPFSGAGPAGPGTQVPGVLAYYEVMAQIASGALVPQWDNATLTPYAYSSQTGEWVSYDDPNSLAYKVAYVNARGLGGAMVWSIDDDDFANGFPLLTKVKSILDNPQSGPQLPDALLAGNVTVPDLHDWSLDKMVDPKVGISGAPGVAVFDGRLYALHEGRNYDGQLWYTSFDGTTWATDTKIEGPEVSSPHQNLRFRAPHAAAVVFNGTLYCLYSGTDGILHYISTTDGSNWSKTPATPFTTAQYSGPPGVAKFGGKLYCMHEGAGESGQLRYSTFDGAGWTDLPVPDRTTGTAGPPAVAVLNGKLYCLRQGNGQDGRLWYTTYDGTTWSADQPVPNVSIANSPTAVIANGKLYCFYEGKASGAIGNGQLWYTIFEGVSWSASMQVPNLGTSGPPGVAVFGGELYCLHEGLGEDGWLWYTTLSVLTLSQDQNVPNVGTSGPPGVAVFGGQLYALHQGIFERNELWYTTSFDGTTWAEDTQVKGTAFGGISSPHTDLHFRGPHAAAVVFNGTLYCLHEGIKNREKDGQLHYTTTDGTNWSADKNTGIATSGPPGVAEYGGLLYWMHEGAGEDGQLWYGTFDGETLSTPALVPKNTLGTAGPPALAVFNNTLYWLRQGKGQDARLRYATYDGTTWSADQPVPNVTMANSPAAAAFNNKLYCFYEGKAPLTQQGNGQLWFTVFNGISWSSPQQYPNVTTSGPPGLAVLAGALYGIHEGGGEDGMLHVINLSSEALSDVDLVWKEAKGANSYRYYELDSDATGRARFSTRRTITLDPGAPFFYGALISGTTASGDPISFPPGATLKVTAPDGTIYASARNDEGCLALASGSSLRALIISAPAPGDYVIELTVPDGVPFLLEFETLPSRDVGQTIHDALSGVTSAAPQNRAITRQLQPIGVEPTDPMLLTGLRGLAVQGLLNFGGSANDTAAQPLALSGLITEATDGNATLSDFSAAALDPDPTTNLPTDQAASLPTITVMMASVVPPTGVVTATPTPRVRRGVRVATWNVFHGDLTRNGQTITPEQRMRFMIAAGADRRLAIMAFQEVQQSFIRDFLKNSSHPLRGYINQQGGRSGMNYDTMIMDREYPVGIRNTASQSSDGYLIVYDRNQLNLVSGPSFYQQQAFTQGLSQARPPVEVVFDIIGRGLLFSFFTWHAEADRALAQANVATLYGLVRGRGGPGHWIIAGDLNVQHTGLQGAVQQAQVFDQTLPDLADSEELRHYDNSLDYIITDGEARNTITQNMPTSLWDTFYLSDSLHYALFAYVRFR
jgi:chitinase